MSGTLHGLGPLSPSVPRLCRFAGNRPHLDDMSSRINRIQCGDKPRTIELQTKTAGGSRVLPRKNHQTHRRVRVEQLSVDRPHVRRRVVIEKARRPALQIDSRAILGRIRETAAFIKISGKGVRAQQARQCQNRKDSHRLTPRIMTCDMRSYRTLNGKIVMTPEAFNIPQMNDMKKAGSGEREREQAFRFGTPAPSLKNHLRTMVRTTD